MTVKYLLCLAVVLTINPATAGDAQKGADSFAANCAVCHSLANPVKNKVGPGLYAIIDSPSGQVAGFQYSSALKSVNLTWSKAQLDAYLSNPASVIPGNKMPFKGMSNADERADLIEFLAQQKK